MLHRIKLERIKDLSSLKMSIKIIVKPKEIVAMRIAALKIIRSFIQTQKS